MNRFKSQPASEQPSKAISRHDATWMYTEREGRDIRTSEVLNALRIVSHKRFHVKRSGQIPQKRKRGLVTRPRCHRRTKSWWIMNHCSNDRWSTPWLP